MDKEELEETLLHLKDIDQRVRELRDQVDHLKHLKRQRLTQLDMYLEEQDDQHPLKKLKNDICTVLVDTL